MAKGLSATPQQEENEENRDRDTDQPEQRPADCAPFAFGFVRCFHELAMVDDCGDWDPGPLNRDAFAITKTRP